MTNANLDAPEEITPDAIMDPTTGMLIPVDDFEEIAAAVDRVRESEREGRAFIATAARILAAYLDRDNRREGVFGRYGITVDSPRKTEVDGALLVERLQGLVDDGVLTESAASAAVEQVVTYKPRLREISKLRSHADPRVVEAVAECEEDVEKTTRRITKVSVVA